MQRINGLDYIALILLIIGGLNWGLVGLFNFDLVQTLLGGYNILSRLVYILVGLSALYTIATSMKLANLNRERYA
jgi:uncharacterized membrane protein YuzA (DUF378 family)